MRSRKKPFPVFQLVIHYTCLAPILVIGVLSVFYPPIRDPGPSSHKWVFFLLLLIALGTFPLLGLIDKLYLSLGKLKELSRRSIDAAIISLKTGLIGAASIAAFCSFLGATDYLVCRKPARLMVFLGFWLFEYLLTLYWLKRGEDDVKQIIAVKRRRAKKKTKRSAKPPQAGRGPRSGANR